MDEKQISKASQKDSPKVDAPVYGKVRFGVPAQRTVSDRYGRVSCVMLDAIVPVVGTGLAIKTAIYANLERKSDGVSVVPSAYLPKKVLLADAEGAADAFLAHVENAAAKWNGYEAAYDAAAAALIGFADPASAAALKSAAPVTQRPSLGRLVNAGGAPLATAQKGATA
jgi:hypothetical protein